MLEQRVKLTGYEHLTKVLDSGRGVIVGTAHYGNPEIAVQVAGVLGLDVLVLAEPLQPPSFAAHMERIRTAFGTKYIDVGFGAIADCIRHARKGGVLAIAADRDIQGKGVPIAFFGDTDAGAAGRRRPGTTHGRGPRSRLTANASATASRSCSRSRWSW